MYAVALTVAAVIGFVSLSYEIVWFRVYAYLIEDRAAAFGLLLGAYLTGVAVGAYWSGLHCRDRRSDSASRQLRQGSGHFPSRNSLRTCR